MEFELQSFDQRLGKFEGVQQQHDQRLAAIEQRLGTIEVLVRDIPAEGHREREALRTALTREIHQARVELAGQTESVRTELHQTRDELTDKIDGVRDELTGKIDGVRDELTGKIDGVRTELHQTRDELTDKIDGVRDELYQTREELTNKIRTEVHQARDELTDKIDGVRTELTIQLESYRREVAGNRVELNGRIDLLSNKIDGLYKWIIGILIAVGVSVIASLLKGIF